MSKRTAPRGFIVPLDELKFGKPETLDELRQYLQAALQLEHITIPPYLTAMYTLRPGTNRPAFFTIRSVVLEEMLHMTLVANVLNAVGGTPLVADPDFVRSYPAKLPFSAAGTREVGLAHFSREALETFLFIEHPESKSQRPNPTGWTSIGEFYAVIRDGLTGLVEKLGEDRVFTGEAGDQVGDEDFYNSGGEVVKVHDLASALLALDVVSDQGEGFHDSLYTGDDLIFGQERQVAHYFRFKEIADGRRYNALDTPHDDPSGEPVEVTWDDVYPIDGASTVAGYAKYPDKSVYEHAVAFNEAYARMLGFLQEAFTGQPRVMAHAVPIMLELRDRAHALYRNPHPDPVRAERGIHASATFEIDQPLMDRGVAYVAAAIAPEGVLAEMPVDLSALIAPTLY